MVITSDFSPYTIEEHATEEDWLNARSAVREGEWSISSTEASTVMGVNPWMSAAELYDIKKGIRKREDISGKPAVVYGRAMEPSIRDQAMLELPYFDLDYRPYDIYRSNREPFMTATLDGYLTVRADNPWRLPIGATGLLEVKTSQLRSYEKLAEWKTNIPLHYYCQMLHAAYVIDAAFVINPSRLRMERWSAGPGALPEIYVTYHMIDLRDPDVIEDQKRIIAHERSFVEKNLERNRRPAVALRA